MNFWRMGLSGALNPEPAIKAFLLILWCGKDQLRAAILRWNGCVWFCFLLYTIRRNALETGEAFT
jgi:hypothetical protein